MFSKILNCLTLTSEIANDVFPNIYGGSYDGDTSFLATLRALVAPRMSKEDTLYLTARSNTYRETALKGYGDEDGVKMLSNGLENNTILVCGLCGTEGSVHTALKMVDDAFLRVYPKFEELKDLRAFVSKQADMRFYINREDQSVVVFCGSFNHRFYHFIQSVISRLLPWYFEDKPLDEKERELVRALTLKTSVGYEKIIEEFATKYDFRSKRIEKMLGGFELRSKRKYLSTVQNDIASKEQKIEQLMMQYNDIICTLEELRIKECGLQYQIKEGITDESEIVDYFVCNKHIFPLSVTDNNMEIIVDCTIENYDPDMYEQMINNTKSYLYTGYDIGAEVFKSVETRRKFLDAIFGEDAVLKIKVCAYYNLDLRGSVSSIKRYNYPPEYANCLINPHFDFHACIGNNRPIIDEFLRKGDYVAAIEQCMSSAKNLNLSEGSQTVAPFLQRVFNSGCKAVILMPDGTSCTPTEAYNWLLAQEETTQEVDK